MSLLNKSIYLLKKVVVIYRVVKLLVFLKFVLDDDKVNFNVKNTMHN